MMAVPGVKRLRIDMKRLAGAYELPNWRPAQGGLGSEARVIHVEKKFYYDDV